tara:strand:- start:244 stop:990 length:747 start_codon:yes stop_codon:yes gene_type:complete
MERNIFLEIEYLGSNYFGFQIQEKRTPAQNTVQAQLEKAIYKLFKEKIRIAYAGRTDRGVHAKAFAVNFKVDSKIPLKSIKKVLNDFLPPDIRVKKVKRVSIQFHARFSAKSKIYRYIIYCGSNYSVFNCGFVWHIATELNLSKLRSGAKKLIGKKNFFVFAKEAKKYKDCIRDLMDIRVRKYGNYIYIDIKANGFLRNMARNIVTFLVKVAKEEVLIKDISAILKQKKSYVNKPAPACGLYFYKVYY